jgi:O-antigen/teichoic acid export membrane protein
MSTYTKSAVKGATIVLIISLIAAFFGYLVRFILARNLTIEEYGLFYSVFAFLGLFGMFRTFGFDKALIKFIPEFKHHKKYTEIKSSIIYAAFIQLITNSIIILGVYLFSNYLSINFFHNPQASIVLKLMAIALFLDSFVQVIKFSLQGFKKMNYFSGIDLIRMLLILGVIIIGLKLNYGILSPVIAHILAPIVLTIIFSYILIKNVFPQFLRSSFIIDKGLIKTISKYGAFIMVTTIGGVVLGYTDTLILTYFSGLTSVALYNVALPTAKLFLYFPRAIAGILLPLTSELWIQNKKNLIKAGIESLYKYSMIIIVPAVFAMFSFSEILISLLFGKSYVLASNTLKILSIGMIFGTLNSVCVNFFAGIGKPQINSKIIYTAAIFNLVANLIVIPIWGIIGAAITTSLSYFIMMVIGLINIRKFIKVEFPVLIWSKTLISGIIFVFLIWILKKIIFMNVWVESIVILAISGTAYIALLLLLGAVNVNELKDLYRRIVK